MSDKLAKRRRRKKPADHLEPLRAEAGRIAQMIEVKPHPVAVGIFAAVRALMGGAGSVATAAAGIGAMVETTDTRICPRCGVFVLWQPDEAPPVCKCGADLAAAPKATRADVKRAFEDFDKPKH